MSDLPTILEAASAGDPAAASELLPLVYQELRTLAAARLALERPGQTLQPTALVHEAYLRLVGDRPPVTWNGRGHFFAAASEAMRRILVENARAKGRLKRGGGQARRGIDETEIEAPELHEDVLALDKALVKLAATDAQAAQIVNLRYFAGLTLPEAARVLNVSPRSADRLWAYARAWLHQELRGGP